MKIKQVGRMVGAIDATIFSSVSYLFHYPIISNFNYNFFLDEHPIESKTAAAIYLGVVATNLPICALFITDGLVDVAKGTHHYFGCKVLQKLTRNPETRKKIASELEEQLKITNEPLRFNFRK